MDEIYKVLVSRDKASKADFVAKLERIIEKFK